MKTIIQVSLKKEISKLSFGIHTCLILLMLTTLNVTSVIGEEYSQWNLPDGAKYRLGKGQIHKVLYSPKGEYIEVDCSIGIWVYDAYTGKPLRLYSGQDSQIEKMEFSLDGSNISYFDGVDSVQFIDTSTWNTVKSIPLYGNSIRSVIFSPDRNTLVSANSSYYQKDYSMTSWDVNRGVPRTTFEGHTSLITSMAFSSDGKTLVTSSWDRSVRIWDATTGENRYTYKKHTDGVAKIIFYPNSTKFAAVGYNRSGVYEWDIETGSFLGAAAIPLTPNSVFSPDGSLIAIAKNDNLYLWDFESKEMLFELTSHTYDISTLAFSPDGRTLVSGAQAELIFWDVKTGAQKLSIPGHATQLFGLAISPKNRTVAIGGRHGIHLWDISSGEYNTRLNEHGEKHWAIAFSPDGQTLASDIGWSFRLWNLKQGVPFATNKGYLGNEASGYGIASIAYSPDGRYLASGSSDGTVQLWHLGRTHKGTLYGHKGGLWDIAFSPDSRYLLSGSLDCTVRLWDVNNQELITTFIGHDAEVQCVAYSPKGNIVASGGKDNTVILWDVSAGKQIRQLKGHPNSVTSVALSPNGEILASVGYTDNRIRLWDVQSGESLPPLSGQYYKISFSADGSHLVSVNSGGTAMVWDWESITGKDEKITIIPEDVNKDGVVDIQDLIFVVSQFGKAGTENIADVNNDGVVDVTDFVLVAGEIENLNSAPPVAAFSNNILTVETVKMCVNHAQSSNHTSDKYRRGVAFLEQLLIGLTPKKIALLPNFPNPFNPETWIPFQLAKSSDVTIQINASNGQLVRHIDLGYRPAGNYHSRHKAVYWNGMNDEGEPVASGLYFYTMSAGEFTATRRMLIIK
ncbi:PD40 domain-containing protein [Candidatus Poribacteria bacterium]|nr:PD40 domain-containing protein [Candidatus Poribacteria bacterium]